MQQPDDNPLKFDITVRVGCSLVYEVTGSASILLNLKLAPDRRRAVLFEALTLGDNLASQEFTDSHGNRVCRVTLEPGANFFRHDAIVAVPSKPDNNPEHVQLFTGETLAQLLERGGARSVRVDYVLNHIIAVARTG